MNSFRITLIVLICYIFSMNKERERIKDCLAGVLILILILHMIMEV